MEKLRQTIQSQEGIITDQQTRIAEQQRLLESQGNAIKEANEEIKRQREGLAICETAANSMAVQAKIIASLRSALASALNFTEVCSSIQTEAMKGAAGASYGMQKMETKTEE